MLVVFDLDGTLVDSRRDLADAANALIVERGGAPLPIDAIAAMVGEGAGLLVERALAAAGLHAEDHSALPRFLELYDERLLVHTRAYPGISEALRDLSRFRTLAVLTNKPLRASRQILDGLGLLGLFAQVVGGDGPHARKPDPAGLLAIVAASAAAARDTVLVGDSRFDMATARAAGTRLCIARYGFGYRPDEMVLGPGELAVDAPSDLPLVIG